jgi:serine phosphatase RsbU (regulator of sigma subunit)
MVLDSEAPPLGMFDDLVIPTSAPVPLTTDDVLFVATDGLFEAAASDGTLLGREYCIQLTAANCRSSVENIVDELRHATRTFADGMALRDNLTIVIAKEK